MPHMSINDAELYYEVQGSGPPLVMVHGSWTDQDSWAAAAPRLAERFRVITYDRRGHSRSASMPLARSRAEHEDDLADLIDRVGEPAYVAGNSFGGVIALGLAARRPDLFRRLAVHEPPAASLSTAAETARAVATMYEVCAEIDAGAHASGAQRFVEEVALGPGGWQLLPEAMRATFVRNAPTFAAELHDSAFGDVVDTERVEHAGLALLITKGTESPSWFHDIAERLSDLLPKAETATIADAGHAPHLSHPDEYAALLTAFFVEQRALAA